MAAVTVAPSRGVVSIQDGVVGEFSDLITRELAGRGWSLRDAARASGGRISHQAWSYWKRNMHVPDSPTVWVEISETLGIPVSWIEDAIHADRTGKDMKSVRTDRGDVALAILDDVGGELTPEQIARLVELAESYRQDSGD